MEISKKQRIALQKLMSDDGMAILQDVASLLLQSMASGPIVRETEFETIVQAVGRDERKRFATSFLEQLEKLAHEN